MRARAALENYFREHSFPRLTLGLIVAASGLVGFIVSHVLLHRGLFEMWLRYPLAVLGGYGMFLVLLRLWVEIERIRYDPKSVAIPLETAEEKYEPPIRSFSYERDGKSWWDWLDVLEVPEFGEGCLIAFVAALLIGIAAGISGVLFSFIMAGSELMAEVCLDAFVVGMLYRHLRIAASEHWLATAVKRTWISALFTAGGLALIGYLCAKMAPDSHSIGSALKQIFSERQ